MHRKQAASAQHGHHDKKQLLLERIDRFKDVLKSKTIVVQCLDAMEQCFGGEKRQEWAKEGLSIVCYGLGSFASSQNALFQLAYVAALVEQLKSRHPDAVIKSVEVFDPVMTEVSIPFIPPPFFWSGSFMFCVVVTG